jgi:hypothetical protein
MKALKQCECGLRPNPIAAKPTCSETQGIASPVKLNKNRRRKMKERFEENVSTTIEVLKTMHKQMVGEEISTEEMLEYIAEICRRE